MIMDEGAALTAPALAPPLTAAPSEHRACTSRAFSSKGLMFSGDIASFTSGKGPDDKSGLGLPTAAAAQTAPSPSDSCDCATGADEDWSSVRIGDACCVSSGARAGHRSYRWVRLLRLPAHRRA
ncbi:hypothetical protein NUW54_g14438 [Trametes sanguinea]|uniref:Uncharacterized protein n=1 Tax=Trametes sanguinea TaxID=158606 RepID=A0ACC1MCX3_9APHY|nr:hypothetical protein NUW54_g14438 [Trametes sanguinea]